MSDLEKNKELARQFLNKSGIKVMRAQSIDLLPKMPLAMILNLAWAGNHLDCSGANGEPHFQI